MTSIPKSKNDVVPAPDIETSSEDYASRFSGRAGDYLLRVQEVSVESLLDKYACGSVIDVGGGHGQLLNLYQKLGMSVTVHGSDKRCFARLGSKLDTVTKVVSDLRSLPYPDRSFDVVVSVRLISHVDDWETALSEMCRVARHAVVIDYPNKRSLNALSPLLFKLKRGIEKNTRTYTLFTHNQLRKQFQRCGLTEVTEYRQFFLPMVVHRMFKAGKSLRGVESVCRSLGLTSLLGSPVTLRAERATEES